MKNVDIKQAAALLKAGEIVAFPTETVYGLGADATNEKAIQKVFSAKERPYDHPLIVHLANMEQIKEWADDFPLTAQLLAQAFWPGPLTLVLRKKPHVLDIVTGHQNTIAIRFPKHPVAQALLQAFGGGLVAPSANKFTHISPTTSRAVVDELGDRIEFLVEGGVCSVGLESTIVDVTQPTPTILRPGMITGDMISAVLKMKVHTSRQDTPTIRTPGMHHLHYAPQTKTRLKSYHDIVTLLENLQANDLPAAFVLYTDAILPTPPQIKIIKMPHIAEAYARELYQTLRSLDHQGFKQIILEQVPDDSAWEAIRDRLMRATAER